MKNTDKKRMFLVFLLFQTNCLKTQSTWYSSELKLGIYSKVTNNYRMQFLIIEFYLFDFWFVRPIDSSKIKQQGQNRQPDANNNDKMQFFENNVSKTWFEKKTNINFEREINFQYFLIRDCIENIHFQP